MESNAFARARSFLDYQPLAKWLAIICSVVSAVLYLFLLTLLGCFIDLMVNQGEIPPYHKLPAVERTHFAAQVELPDDAEGRAAAVSKAREELQAIGIDPAFLQPYFQRRPADLKALSVLWYAKLPGFLSEAVGPAAGDRAREALKNHVKFQGLEVAENPAGVGYEQARARAVDLAVTQPVGDMGLLSLVARTRAAALGWAPRVIARWNPWTWAQGNEIYLVGLFLAALGLAVVRWGLIFLSNLMAARAVLEAVTRLRRGLYQHTNRLGALAFNATGPSEAAGVSTRHLEVVHDSLFLWLTAYIREPIKFGLLLVLALLLNFWLALAFVMFALLVWLFGGQIAALYRHRARIASKRSAEQLGLLQESIQLMRLVKMYLMEQFAQQRVERQLSGYAREQMRRYVSEAIARPLFTLLGLGAVMILLLVAGYVVLHGQLGVTTFITLAAILVSLYWPAVQFLDARTRLRRGRESAKALFTFLARTGTISQAIEAKFLPPMQSLLEFDNVTLVQPGNGRKLLDGVSMTVQKGRKLALVGPDDDELHALVYLLMRFLDPASGEIRIDGENIRWVTLESLRSQSALVMQNQLVFNDTIADNIGCGDATYNLQRIIEAAKLAHAHQFIQKLPKGYETVIGEMGHPLKPGEQFRIALARAILRDPAIFVIEEPREPFDEDTNAMIDDTFQRVLPDRTAIFLPHRLTTIRGCDRIVLLVQGKIEATGEHRDLLNSSDLYRHLQYLEFNEFTGVLAAKPAPREPAGI